MAPVLASATVVPVCPVRLPGRGVDGTTRGDRSYVERLIHHGADPVVIEARPAGGGAVALRARGATQAAADFGLERLRFWTGVDDDITPFLSAHADDALIGASVRDSPETRPYRRPMPFDVLVAAVCEQLIDDERAREIKREIVRHFGRREGELADGPDAATVAALSPAELEGCGLAAKRAITLIRAATEVARGRVDLLDPAAYAAGWKRLRTIDGIGPWTLSLLALHGQGQLDALPAGDLAFRVIVGRLQNGRDSARAEPAEVAAFFAPYAPWRGLAAWHVLRLNARSALT